MKIERKYMAHYLNAAFGSGDASYTRLGSDLEEYSPELTANVEKKSNIVGETTVTINGYQKQGEVSPYYAEPGDPLFERLQAIVDGDLVLDDLKTDIVEVKLWDKDTAGDVGPAPYTAGLWCRGITVLDRRENLLGRVTQRCRAEFTLRLCLPRTDADNAARLLDLQTWAAAESAAGRGPVLGNAGREALRAEQGRMERADAGGTAIYTVRLQAEYTQVYTEETT